METRRVASYVCVWCVRVPFDRCILFTYYICDRLFFLFVMFVILKLIIRIISLYMIQYEWIISSDDWILNSCKMLKELWLFFIGTLSRIIYNNFFSFPNSPRDSNYKIYIYIHVPTCNLSVASATDPLLKLVSLTFPYFHNHICNNRPEERLQLEERRKKREREIWEKSMKNTKKTQSSSMHICNPCHLPFNNIREPCSFLTPRHHLQ